jgi:hypothetical protein
VPSGLWGFGAGLAAKDSSADVEGRIRGAADSGCTVTRRTPLTDNASSTAGISSLELVKINAIEFTQVFGSEETNIWSRTMQQRPGAIDPDDPAARIVAPIPVGTHLVHENPGGDRYGCDQASAGAWREWRLGVHATSPRRDPGIAAGRQLRDQHNVP